MHTAKCKKLNSKGYKQHGSILTKICKSKAIEKESRLLASKGWGRRRCVLPKKHNETFGDDRNVLNPDVIPFHDCSNSWNYTPTCGFILQ